MIGLIHNYSFHLGFCWKECVSVCVCLCVCQQAPEEHNTADSFNDLTSCVDSQHPVAGDKPHLLCNTN